MIRVIILLIGAFIIWVLFFSKLSKSTKVSMVALAVIISVFGFWFESDANKPRTNVVQQAQVSNCGVNAEHSYRTNYAINLCIRNDADKGDIKRVNLTIIAEQCLGDVCTELQRVDRDLALNLPAQTSVNLEQNLSFEKVSLSLKNVTWSFVVNSVKALK